MKKQTDLVAPKKGMNKSRHPSEVTEGEYTFAMNANIQDGYDNTTFILTNEPSNLKCSGFKEGYYVNKHKYDRVRDRTYFFLYNPTTGCSEIGFISMAFTLDPQDVVLEACGCTLSVVIEDGLENVIQEGVCVYNTVISDYCEDLGRCTGCLDFSKPVTNVSIRYAGQGDELYFSQKGKPARYIKLDYIEEYFKNTDSCTGEVETVCLKCEDLLIFNKFEFPCIEADSIQIGGNLKNGYYEVALAYSDINGEEITDYIAHTTGITIFDYNNIELDQTNLDAQTNQSILVNISNLDTSYDFYKLLVIYRSGNNPEPMYIPVGIYPTSDNSVTISQVPTNVNRISTTEYLYRRVSYLTTDGLEEVGNYLWQHGLTEQKTINLQPVINLAGGFVRWGTGKSLEKLYKNGVSSSKFMTYTRNETYPLSIQFKKRGGHTLNNFIFIPPPPTAEEIAEINKEGFNYLSVNKDTPDCGTVIRDRVWQYTNTAKQTEDFECQTSSNTITEEVEKEFECIGYGVTVEEGALTDDIYGDLVSWINTNKDYILTSTSEDLYNIKQALLNEEDYEDCEPEVPEYCGEGELVSEEVIAYSVESQSMGEQSIPITEYEVARPPQACGVCTSESQTDCGFLEFPIQSDVFIEEILGTGMKVDLKVPTTNMSCSTATSVNNPLIGTHLMDMGVVGNASALLTSTVVSTTSVDFSNRLHKNAIFYTASFTTQDEFLFQISHIECLNVDDNTSNKLRVTVFAGCPNMVEVPVYGRIINDMTLTNDPSKSFIIRKSDLPVNTNTVFIAFDSPMKSEVEVEITMLGEDGTASFSVDGVYSVATFNTNIATTVNNFLNANQPTWESKGIRVNGGDNYIRLRMSKAQFETISTQNLTGNLRINVDKLQEYHTLQPPCGCFSTYKKDIVYENVLKFTDLTFVKKRIWKSICEITIEQVSDCNIIPDKIGTFGYYESTLKYPCNNELYDSSYLDINVSDIPEQIKTKFEQYYTLGATGGKYILNQNTNFTDKPIRHYKFPDNIVSPFMSAFTTQDESKSNNSIIYPIGFVIDNDVLNAFLDIAVNNKLITKEDRDDITGYEIFRGDRRNHKSVIGKGLGFDMMTYPNKTRQNPNTTYYPNYPLNSSETFDSLNGGLARKVPTRCIYTFHSPNTHFERPTLPPEIYVEGFQHGVSSNSFAPLKEHPKYSVLGRRALNLTSTLAGFEVALESAQMVAQLSVNSTTGSPILAPASLAALTIALVTYGTSVPFKFNSYRYDWINTFENLGAGYNHAYIGLAEGQYFGFRPNSFTNSVNRGNEIISYLEKGNKWMTRETTGDKFYVNNFQRENSVFFKFSNDYPVSYFNDLHDTSRMNIPTQEAGQLGVYTGTTFAPYISLIQYQSAQYGSVNSVEWVTTGYCGNLDADNTCDIIFGGDTYISRMAVKRKFPFFTATAYKQASSTPFKYSSNFNINTGTKTGRGWLDFKTAIDSFGAMATVPLVKSAYNLWDGNGWLDNDGNNLFYVTDEYKFLTHYYGIPYFLVESEINCWNRYAGVEDKMKFYPSVGDALDWVQHDTVSMEESERFLYDRIYSSTPHRYPSSLLPVDFSAEKWAKKHNLENAVIYSQKDVSKDANRSPWLNYKANDFHTFGQELGKLQDITGIESEQVLVRFTDGFTILGSVDKLKDKLTSDTYKLGAGGIFDERAVNFNTTDLGHAGTQHKAILSTPFGHIWVDAKRGKVHNLKPGGKELQELSLTLNEWFKEQLPFKILRKYPKVNIDQSYNGLGLSLGYDDRTKRVLLTKLDYIPKSSDMKYDDEVGFYTGTLTCEEGYELINGACVRTEITKKTLIGEELPTEPAGGIPHGLQYPNLYSAFTIQGAGLTVPGSATGYSFEKLTASFWTGNGVVADRLTTKFGKWIAGQYLTGVWYGGASVVEVSSSKIYHVVMAADNLFRLKIDGVLVLESNQIAIGQQNTISPLNYDAQTFRQVHIYPIELTRGCHTITIEALNQGGEAMFGACILDNTVQELRNATSYDDLNFLYTTEDQEYFYKSDEGIFECPEGFLPISSDICADCMRIDESGVKNFELIPFENENYFEKAHFTVGYSFLTESWISYYSFHPNYYNSYTDYFQTGVNSTTDKQANGLWTHHPMISSYQVFYGKLYPFVIEYASKTKNYKSLIESVEYFMETRKYYNYYDYTDIFGKSFNKAYIYNNFQNSGLLNLNVSERNNVNQMNSYPRYNTDSIDILQTEVEGVWSFNYLFNHIKNEKAGIPPFLYDNVAIDKKFNDLAFDYTRSWKDRLRGDYFQVRLIQDQVSQYKYLYKVGKNNRQYYV